MKLILANFVYMPYAMPSLKGSEGLRKEKIKERIQKEGAICHSFSQVFGSELQHLTKFLYINIF